MRSRRNCSSDGRAFHTRAATSPVIRQVDAISARLPPKTGGSRNIRTGDVRRQSGSARKSVGSATRLGSQTNPRTLPGRVGSRLALVLRVIMCSRTRRVLFSIDSAGFYWLFPTLLHILPIASLLATRLVINNVFCCLWPDESVSADCRCQLLTLHALYAAQGLNNGRVSVRPSLCLSVPSIDSSSDVRAKYESFILSKLLHRLQPNFAQQ